MLMFLFYADTFVSLVSGTKINFKTTEKTSKNSGTRAGNQQRLDKLAGGNTLKTVLTFK